MGNTIQLRVDKSLQKALEDIRGKVSKQIKKEYDLDEITIHGTSASKIAAAKLSGRNVVNIKIERVGLNKGVLKLL